MIRSLLAWLDDRTGYKALIHEALFERVPGGARWRYVWGSTLVFTFVLQMITGTMLWMGYSPSTKTAWESVYYIQNEMTLGWLVRGIHHFAAQTMVVLMASGNASIVSASLFDSTRSITATIAAELAEAVFGGHHYRMLFLIGAMLFIVTFLTNLAGDLIMHRLKGKLEGKAK